MWATNPSFEDHSPHRLMTELGHLCRERMKGRGMSRMRRRLQRDSENTDQAKKEMENKI